MIKNIVIVILIGLLSIAAIRPSKEQIVFKAKLNDHWGTLGIQGTLKQKFKEGFKVISITPYGVEMHDFIVVMER